MVYFRYVYLYCPDVVLVLMGQRSMFDELTEKISSMNFEALGVSTETWADDDDDREDDDGSFVNDFDSESENY